MRNQTPAEITWRGGGSDFERGAWASTVAECAWASGEGVEEEEVRRRKS